MATGTDFSEEYVDKLTQALHAEPAAEYVFWQFAMELFDFSKNRGDTIKVNGPNWLDPFTDPDTDAKLTNLGTKLQDQTVQTFTLNQQSVTLDEFLLKNPLELQEYDIMHSEHNVIDINQSLLAENYFRWQDDVIIKRFEGNTYRQFGGATTAAAMTTSNVHSTNNMIDNATILSRRLIPKFPDGNYICVITPGIKGTLLKEQKFLDATTRGLAAGAAPVFTNELGVYAGIRFVESNNVDQVTVGQSGTPFSADQAFMFGTSLFDMFPLGFADNLVPERRMSFLRGRGAGPVVKVEGMPVEVRLNEITDYGRFRTATWITHCKYTVLDPKPGSGKTEGTDSRFINTIYGYAS